MQDQQNSNRSELGNLTVKDLVFKYVRFLPVFMLFTSLALFGAYVYLHYTTKIYKVGSSLMIKNESSDRSADKFKDLLEGGEKSNVQSEIEILKSRPLMTRVVNALNLNTSYFAVGKFKSPNIYKYGPFLLRAYSIADSGRGFSIGVNFINEWKEFSN